MFIDTDNYEASGVKAFNFPGGEPHVVLPEQDETDNVVFAKIRNSNDFMTLMVLLDAFNRRGEIVHLFMPYFPGARQDRSDLSTPITVQVVANMLGTFSNVFLTVLDLHSIAGLEAINRAGGCVALNVNHALKNSSAFDVKWDAVIAPDKGAVERADRVATLLGVELIECGKTRDFATGKLSGFTVPDMDWDDKPSKPNLLIVDDIADGGGTFAGLAEVLVEKYDPFNLSLWVTHGIFSQGESPFDRFTNVYTTDSFARDDLVWLGGNLEVVSCLNVLKQTKPWLDF